MSLAEKLASIREESGKRIPPEGIETMHRATEELRNSGIEGKAMNVGVAIPLFELPDSEGKTVRVAERLKNGPLVLTFYRGDW